MTKTSLISSPSNYSSSSYLEVIAFSEAYEKVKDKENSKAEKEWNEVMQMWKRPACTIPETSNQSILFFQLDVDYYTEQMSDIKDSNILKKYAFTNTEVPIIRLYGITNEGNSVLAHVHGFFPYFFCESPSTIKDVHLLMNKLDQHLDSQSSYKHLQKKILQIESVKKESVMNYKLPASSNFYKVTAALPRMIAACRNVIESGIYITNDICIANVAYEANIPFALRFLVDAEIHTCSWIQVNSRSYTFRDRFNCMSGSQIEIDVHFSDLISFKPEDKYIHIPPVRLLSFDIECVRIEGDGFPTYECDPVIQISSVMQIHNSSEIYFKCIFTLNECASIAGAYVFWFDDERTMLTKWADFIRFIDPDILTGYNCINFDMTYLINRSKVLKLENFRYLTKIKNSECRIKDAAFSSKALGTHENKDINMEGRVLFDVLELVRRDYKLKSYTLNAVSFEFLKEQKEDVHYSMIGDLQRGNPETRRRIAVYCIKDSYLPLRLIDKLLFLYNYVEMARVTGTPINYLLTRGQQIKVTSQLLRQCRKWDYVLPSVKRISGDSNAQYEGATVLDPVKGFYTNPIATLDFASLYPSIMMAHNLCYSTLINKNLVHTFNPEDITVTTTNPPHYFVKPKLRRGILPLIVEELISARSKAKKEMALAEDSLTKMVLNGRQLALKISANSVYGFTGATTGGQLPCLEVATSITCFGRDMIEYTKQRVEELYRVDKGYENNARVIYGDTDSVMVNFGTTNINEAMKLGREAAELISKEFIHPIRLEFEKVYCPYLLMNKKRYVGLLYTKPDKYDKIDSKGIETVRRDFCILVQQMIDIVLKKMLIERDVEGAKEYTKQKIAELLQNKIDMSLLVVTKSIGKIDYDTRLPHIELAKKLRQRDPGTAPNVGDRVSYIIVKGSKGQAQYERAEDPLYVLDNNLPIDTQHYLDSIKNPIIRIFEGVMNNPESLFSGEHTRAVTVLTSASGALSKFVRKSLQCLHCRAVIKNGALCNHCKPNHELSIVIEKTKECRIKEKEYSALWTQCQRCQGSLHQDVICINRDCPIFYRRMKVKKDINVIQDALQRLATEW